MPTKQLILGTTNTNSKSYASIPTSKQGVNVNRRAWEGQRAKCEPDQEGDRRTRRYRIAASQDQNRNPKGWMDALALQRPEQRAAVVATRQIWKKKRRETQSHKRAGHGVRAEPPVGLSQSRHGLDYYVSQKSSEKYKWMFDYDVKLWNRVFLQWMCWCYVRPPFFFSSIITLPNSFYWVLILLYFL